ncbi:maestro heat-like repeat-containing protein family member 1 [Ammospiza caudacuta]|uniref:maestro heat-like repeat-containing protein family member 1 n=1 Tax=Ammospiza caudacuta TaxID=2857398 RepID=UPI0027390EC8|nr:maestro heat-like repeat-containing protein family member 1 [Ammospiza caudacuta]
MMETRLRRLALPLLEAGADAEPDVRQQLRDALSGLGAADPEELLQVCGEYLRNHDKLPAAQRALILASMGAVVRSHLGELGKAAANDAIALGAHEISRAKNANDAIALGAHEISRAKEAHWEWQEAAGALLVELGRRFLARVMEELLRLLPPAALPHPGLVRALADLAAANVFGMVPFLGSILGTLLPLLPTARADSMKCTLCYALQRFSESIQEYLAGQEQGPDPTVRGDAFAPELGAAFDVLSLQWVQSRDAKVRVAVLEALGPLSALIPPEQLQEQLPKLLPTILGLYRKHPEPFPISKSLCQVLEASVPLGSRALEPQLEPLLGTLLNQLCAPAEPSIPTSSKNHTELLRCFSVLARPFPQRALQWLLPRLECSSQRHRQGALRVLRHLLNSAPSQMEMQKVSILSSLRAPLQDGSPEVRRALLQLVGAMGPRGFLQEPGAEALLEFLVLQCDGPGPAAAPGGAEEIPEDAASDDVRSVGVSTLILLSSTVPGVAPVLWRFLLRALLRPGLSRALAPLCRSLALLAPQMQREPPESGAQGEEC